eukprot:Opistho-2@87252
MMPPVVVKAEGQRPGPPADTHRVKYHCKNCRNPDPPLIEDYRAGDLICGDCGLVLGDRVLDVRSEWRTFSNDKNESSGDPSRVGGITDGIHLNTQIASGPNSRDLGRIHGKMHKEHGHDKHFLEALNEIRQMSDRIQLTLNICERAKQLYRQIFEHGALKGRKMEAVAAACIYIACRQENVPRTFKEICAVANNVPVKEIGRCYKFISQTLEIQSTMNTIKSDDYMARFCSLLRLPKNIENAAKHVAVQAGNLNLTSGKNPVSVAAAAIYMVSQVSDFPKSQKDIRDIAGVADVTIRNAYRDIYPMRSQLFPATFVVDKNRLDSLPPPT